MTVSRKKWYLEIGKNSGNSGTYVRVELYYDVDAGVLSDVENIGEDENGAAIYDLSQELVDSFRIKFVKRRYDGFRYSHHPNTDKVMILEFKGGDTNSTRSKERENILQLGINIADWLVTLKHNSYGPWDCDVIVYENNVAQLSTPGWDGEVEYPYNSLNSLVDGSTPAIEREVAQEQAPFKASVDNGETMFPNGFYFDNYDLISASDQSEEVEQSTDAYEETPPPPPPEPENLISDPDDVPSNFSDLQKEVCDTFLLPDEFDVEQEMRICPTCIPNPDFVPNFTHWYQYEINEVWLNEATCEYNISIKAPEFIESSLVSGAPFTYRNYQNLTDPNTLAQNDGILIREGIKKILSFRNKIITDNIVCSNPPLTPEGECEARLLQADIEQIKLETQIPSGQSDGTSVSVFGINTKLLTDTISVRNPSALELFTYIKDYEPLSKYTTATSDPTSRLLACITIPATLVDSLPTDPIAQAADDAQEINGTNSSGDTPPNVIIKGSKIKNTFNKRLPQAFKVFAEYQAFFFHTTRANLKIDTDYVQETVQQIPYYALRYETKFERFYDDLKGLLENNDYNVTKYDERLKQAFEVKIIFEEATENKKYAIKTVQARYIGCPFKRCGIGLSKFKETYNSQETLMGYVAKYNQMVERLETGLPPWLDFLTDFTSPALQTEYGNQSNSEEAQGCLDNYNNSDNFGDIFNDLVHDISMSFSDALEFSANSLNCRTIQNYDPLDFQTMMQETAGGFSENAQILRLLGDYKNYGESMYGAGADVVEKTKDSYRRLIKDKQRGEKNFFERLTGKPLKTYIYALRANPKEAVGFLLQKINPCNWEALTLDIVLCFMKGLQPIDILKKTAKSLMGDLDPLQLEEVWNTLPQDVRDEIIETIGDLKLPWVYAREQKARQALKPDPNEYQDNMDPPTAPQDVSQASPNENLQNADEVRAAARDAIKEIEKRIRELTPSEQEYLSLIDDLNTLYDQVSKYREIEASGVGAYIEFGQKADDLENIDIFNIEQQINELYPDVEELADKRQELSEKTIEATSANLAQAVALMEMADSANPNEYEKAARRVIELVAGAIIEMTVEKLGLDDLKSLVDSLPGSSIFVPIITAAFCPHQQLLDTWIDATFATLDIEPCKSSSWYIPSLPYIPELDLLKVLKVMLKEFVDKLIQRIIAAFVAFLARTLQAILDLTCDVFEGIGGYLLDALNDGEGETPDSLFDAIADAFCTPNEPGSSFANSLNPNSGQETFNDLFRSYGGRTQKEVVLSWGSSLSERATTAMWQELFVTGTSSTGLLDVAWDVTQEFDELRDIFDSEETLQDFFNSITDKIPDNFRQDVIDFLDQLEADRSLTDFCQLYCDIDAGFREGEDSALGIEINQGDFATSFGDILDGFFKGPEDAILDAFGYDESVFGSDAFCEDIQDLYNSDNLTGKQPVLKEPSLFKQVKKEVGDSIFSDIEMAYVRDLIEGKHSYFNNLLADKDNKRLTRGTLFDPSHEFRTKTRFLFSNAANSSTEHRNKWRTAKFPLRLTMRIADNVSDAVDQINKEEDADDTGRPGFKEKIKAFVGNILKPIMAFIELFRLDKPKPTNLLPNTVGKSYYDTLTNSKLQFDSKNDFIFDGEETSTEKQWISLGFTSLDVITKKPTIKRPDVSLSYKNSKGDYKVITGFSPYTTIKDRFQNNVLELSDDPVQKYSIIVQERLIFKMNPFINTDENGDVVTSPLNRMAQGVWNRMFEELGVEQSDVKTTTIENDLRIPYDISRYEEIYFEYFEKYREQYGEDLEIPISSLDKYKTGESNQEILPPNKWILMKYLQDRTTGANEQIYNLAQGIVGRETNVYYDSDLARIYESESATDRIYQDLMTAMMKSVLKEGQMSAAGIQSPGLAYGYDRTSKIQFPDLYYVNPESQPEDPRTWYYDKDEEQKILGKSATENPRVMFLDPDIYGGKYKKPKIYIKPAKHTGVMGMMQQFLPEDDGCEPISTSMLFLEEIRETVDRLEVELTRDKRMSYDPDCVKEPPFDLVADSSSHAYLHGIVNLTIRTYIMEMFLRCAPITLQLGSNPGNFDQGLAFFVLDNMRQGLSDTPENSIYIKYGKEEYWYLFLEQMVQTTEREMMSGNITDNNLKQALISLSNYRKQYHQPDKNDRRILSLIKRVVRDDQGNITAVRMKYGYDVPESYQSKFINMIDAVSFCAFGENFKQYLKGRELKFHGGRILTLKQIRKYCKIYAIWKKKDLAIRISSYLVLREFKKYLSLYKQNQTNSSEISSILKYALNPASGMAFGPRIKTGLSSVENLDAAGVSNSTYGDVLDYGFANSKSDFFAIRRGGGSVSDIIQSQYPTGFVVEKYFVIETIKRGTPLIQELKSVIGKRISVGAYKNLWREIREQGLYYFDDNTFISDFFGDAELDPSGEGYTGSIGIKFGVRLSIASLHMGLAPEDSAYGFSEANTNGRIQYFDPNLGDGGQRVSYPTLELLSYEQDILDQPIENYVVNKVPTDNAGEKLKCYIDRMCELKEFNFIMEYLFPVKATVSLMMANAYSGYIESVGEHENERDPTAAPADEEWKAKILHSTKRKMRRLFSTYYDSKETDKEKGQREKSSREFKKLSLPDIYGNLDLSSIPWWMMKRFHDRPFNKNDQECLDGALGSMSQILPDQRMVFKNNVDEDEPYVPAAGDGGAPYVSHPPNEDAEILAELVAEKKLEDDDGDGYYTAIPPQTYDPNVGSNYNPFVGISQDVADLEEQDQEIVEDEIAGVEVNADVQN